MVFSRGVVRCACATAAFLLAALNIFAFRLFSLRQDWAHNCGQSVQDFGSEFSAPRVLLWEPDDYRWISAAYLADILAHESTVKAQQACAVHWRRAMCDFRDGRDNCPIFEFTPCSFVPSNDPEDSCSAQLVVFEANELVRGRKLPLSRAFSAQRWVAFSKEPYCVTSLEDHGLARQFDLPILGSPDLSSIAPEPTFRHRDPLDFSSPPRERHSLAGPTGLPNSHLDSHYLHTLAVRDAAPGFAPVVGFVSNCAADRLEYIRELMKYIRVDMYGKCLKNMPEAKPPPDADLTRPPERSWYNKHKVIARYPFYLAFENCERPADYVSEKVSDGLRAGTLPVYRGTKNIDEFVPSPRSIVRTDKFADPQELSAHLLFLLHNTTAYREHFLWKRARRGDLTIPKPFRNCPHCNRTWLCTACIAAHGASLGQLLR
jgi:Glycosyltransferase family 10 (fucosyltransferase) C-term